MWCPPESAVIRFRLIATSKRQSKLNYGTPTRLFADLAGALFNHMVSGNMVPVPYKGGAPAVTDLMAGAIEVVFAPLIEALPFIKS